MTNIKVTLEEVKENMQDVIVRTLDDFGKPCTYVTVRMKNGFTLRESTTCVDPANYNEEIGKQICLKKIEDKVWFLLGYALQEKQYQKSLQEKQYQESLQDKPVMIQIEEGKLADLIRKANKFEWLSQLSVEDRFDEKGISLIDSTNGGYYKYDDMSNKKVIEDYL